VGYNRRFIIAHCSTQFYVKYILRGEMSSFIENITENITFVKNNLHFHFKGYHDTSSHVNIIFINLLDQEMNLQHIQT